MSAHKLAHVEFLSTNVSLFSILAQLLHFILWNRVIFFAEQFLVKFLKN